MPGISRIDLGDEFFDQDGKSAGEQGHDGPPKPTFPKGNPGDIFPD